MSSPGEKTLAIPSSDMTSFLRSDSRCTLSSEWPQPSKIWACSSLLAFSVSLPWLKVSSFWLRRSAPAYIYSCIHDKVPSIVDDRWIGRKGILSRHPTRDTWSSSPFPFPLDSSSSGKNWRRQSSSLWGRSTCVECSHRWRRRNINSHQHSHFVLIPTLSFEWTRSSLLRLRCYWLGRGNQCCFPSWQPSQTWAFWPLNYGKPNTSYFACNS